MGARNIQDLSALSQSRSLRGNRGALMAETPAWRRPADWLAIPDIRDTDHKFIGLLAIPNVEENLVAVLCTGAYTVDWGDGTAPVNVATNTQANKSYTYSSISSTTECSRGYRQVLVTITPQAGQTFSTLDLHRRHPDWGSVIVPGVKWLEWHIAGASLTDVNTTEGAGGTNTVYFSWLERAVVKNNNITYFDNFLDYCYAVKDANDMDFSSAASNLSFDFVFRYTGIEHFANASFTAAIDMDRTFQNARALRHASVLGTNNVADAYALFNYCYSLRTADLPNTQKLRDGAWLFQYCYALARAPDMSFAQIGGSVLGGVGASGMFDDCFAMKYVPKFYMLGTAAYQMQNAFAQCYSLKAVDFRGGSYINDLTSAFRECFNLRRAVLPSTSSATGYQAFYQCMALQENELHWGASQITSFSATFYECFSFLEGPELTTTAATTTADMFRNLDGLRTFPVYDLAGVTEVGGMVAGTFAMHTLPALDFATVTGWLAFVSYPGSTTHWGMRIAPDLNCAAITTIYSNYSWQGTPTLSRAGFTGLTRGVALQSTEMSVDDIEYMLRSIGKANGAQTITFLYAYGWQSGRPISKASCGTTLGSATVTLTNTSSLAVGMDCYGNGFYEAWNCEADFTNSTFANNTGTFGSPTTPHGLSNGHRVAISSMARASSPSGNIPGLELQRYYWVTNATTYTFQLSSVEGSPDSLVTFGDNGSVSFIRSPKILSINTNISFTLDAPASATASVTCTFHEVDRWLGVQKGWTVS